MIDIRFEKENNRAIAIIDNKVIGKCNFLIENNTWNIINTKVDSTYQGQGIAKDLVTCVIENAKKENCVVIADCSYANKIININRKE